MKKIPLLPNAITAFGLCCGLFVIFKMALISSAEMTYSNLIPVVAILLLAGLADLLDGAIARALKAQSSFGGLFDSLADAISFGVAPSVMVLKGIPLEPGHGLTYLITVSAMIFSVCGVLRLIRFNIQTEENVIAGRVHFTGLPIPAAAISIVSTLLLVNAPEIQKLIDFNLESKVYTLAFVQVVVGYFMISRWKFPSVKVLHIHVPSFHLVLLTAIGAVILFYGISNHFGLVLFTFAWSYILVAMGLSITRLVAGRRNRILEEFEPDSQEE